MVSIGGSWIVGPAWGVRVGSVRHRMILAAHSVLDRIDTVPRVQAGRVLGYNWRYLDGAGHDVTDQVLHAGMVVDTAEAVSADGTVLLRTRRRNGGWSVAVDSGELGEQVDAAAFARTYGSPYDALHVAAQQLGYIAREQ